ncbi:MAG: TIGR04014 family B12-binding domain/radical SAM domain-containing protein [Methanomicrobiaceae archaeon]|nr:TIGR04014 family B12-binding domain/radical SAM domain-containing protein [Methanomicrobiaceae archaeon]
MHVTVISPDIYTYGAMLIGGILREGGYDVSVGRKYAAPPSETVFLSLYSTLHLLDPRLKDFISRHRERGGRCYVGGPVSAYPEIVLGELEPDAVVVGEGENTVLSLLQTGPVPDLPGIAVREGGRIRINPPEIPASLDRPIPLIPDDIGTQDIRGANVYIETHRGCLGSCTFCQVPRFFGHDIRSRTIDSVLAEVRAFKEKGMRRVSISGGTGSLFQYENGTLNTAAFIELLSGMADIMGSSNISAPDIRADCINDEILEAIKKYTIGWIFFGIESGSDRILRLMGKGITAATVSDAIDECRNHGLSVAGSFIVGFPTETAKDFQATKKFIASAGLDDVFVSIAEPIPETPLAKLVLDTPQKDNPSCVPTKGEYRSLGLTESEARCFDLSMHADMYKPRLHVVTDQIFDAYLTEVRRQGTDIRNVTDLLFRYYGRDDGPG